MIDIADARTLALLEAIGAPYYWGKGDMLDAADHWPQGPYDCSGFAQAALLRIGLVRPDAWTDLSAAALAEVCDPVTLGDEQPGDLVFYGADRGRSISHVAVVLCPTMAIGANGGGSRTRGNDPTACVQVRPITYRADFLTVGRLKAEYRP